jgi:hypothetical protein
MKVLAGLNLLRSLCVKVIFYLLTCYKRHELALGVCGLDGRVTAHAHCVVSKHYFCLILHRPTTSQPRVVCLCMVLVNAKDCSNTDSDSGTNMKDVESFMSKFIALLCR